MIKTTSLVGRFVLSKAGRDGGRIHIVVAEEENYVFLVDGDTRKVQSPKRKKLMHTTLLNHRDSMVEELISNQKLTNKLAKAAVSAATKIGG